MGYKPLSTCCTASRSFFRSGLSLRREGAAEHSRVDASRLLVFRRKRAHHGANQGRHRGTWALTMISTGTYVKNSNFMQLNPIRLMISWDMNRNIMVY